MPNFCAYNLPAVVLTAGKEKWECLSDAFSELVQDIQWKVRRTLSFSLHEIAMILGPELTKAHLLPALDAFLMDLDEVKVGVLQNLSKLLGVLDQTARGEYVGLLCSLEMESDNWRFRQLLAQQLGDLFDLYQDDVLEAELYPMFLKLCRDPVAEVRGSSAMQLPQILSRLKALNVKWKDEFMEELGDLATDRVYVHRLSYVLMSECLVSDEEEERFDADAFGKDFLPHLVKLAEDSVPNIRQRCASLFSKLATKPSFAPRHEVDSCLSSLRADKEVDVLRIMGQEIGLGITSAKHNGLPNGAQRDAEVRLRDGEKL